MRPIAPVLVLMAACASCSKEAPPSPEVTRRSVVIRVDGMQRGEGGKTWMAWPESVKGALGRLPGVERVEVDLDHDLFRVTLGSSGASADDLMSAIRALGYRPSSSEATAFNATPETLHPTGAAPDKIRDAIARARKEGKRLVLVDCMGDNWIACRKMSVRTFADPGVRKVIDENFIFVELNVDHEKEAAGWFAGRGIPDTWVLDLDGRMLDRVVGFMEPMEFAGRLRKVLEGR